MKREYYGSMCITARINFCAESEKSIEEVKEELLSMGFGITFYDDDGNEIKKDKLEIVEIEGQIIDEEVRGNVKESYTDSFEIYEENY